MRAGEARPVDLDEVRRRQLEADAEHGVVGAAYGAPAPVSSALAGGEAPAGIEGRKVGAELKRRSADQYEHKAQGRKQARLHHEAAKQDIEADGQALAATMLRLQERPALQQPTQSLLTTAAAERKARVRAQRMVPKKNGSTAGGFGSLPHPGLWKAQPLEAVKGSGARVKAQPVRGLPVRASVAIT
jgi:hypothetical protein